MFLLVQAGTSNSVITLHLGTMLFPWCQPTTTVKKTKIHNMYGKLIIIHCSRTRYPFFGMVNFCSLSYDLIMDGFSNQSPSNSININNKNSQFLTFYIFYNDMHMLDFNFKRYLLWKFSFAMQYANTKARTIGHRARRTNTSGNCS